MEAGNLENVQLLVHIASTADAVLVERERAHWTNRFAYLPGVLVNGWMVVLT